MDFLKDVSSQTTGNNQTVIECDEPIVNAQMTPRAVIRLSYRSHGTCVRRPTRIGTLRLALRLPGSPLELTIPFGWLAANPALRQRYRRQSPILFQRFLWTVALLTACQRLLVAHPGHTALRDYIASYELIMAGSGWEPYRGHACYKWNERFVVSEQLEIETTEILVEFFVTPNSC